MEEKERERERERERDRVGRIRVELVIEFSNCNRVLYGSLFDIEIRKRNFRIVCRRVVG